MEHEREHGADRVVVSRVVDASGERAWQAWVGPIRDMSQAGQEQVMDKYVDVASRHRPRPDRGNH